MTASYGPPRSASRASPWRTSGVAASADARELLQPGECVERVAGEELRRLLDRPAFAPVLVTPVGLGLRRAREVEVEVRRPASRAGGAREDDAEDVGVLVVHEQRAEAQQLARGARRVPVPDESVRPARCALPALEPAQTVAQLRLERERVVAAGLDAHQQAVEGGDVAAGRAHAALERLDEGGAGAGERVEHALAADEVALEQHLDELRDELPEVRVEAVDVLGADALGQLGLGPREVEVEVGVERFLGRRHGDRFCGCAPFPRALPAARPILGTNRHGIDSLPSPTRAAFPGSVDLEGGGLSSPTLGGGVHGHVPNGRPEGRGRPCFRGRRPRTRRASPRRHALERRRDPPQPTL